MSSDPTGQRLPAQCDVDSYLESASGQVANFTGFTNFLNKQLDTNLKPTVNTFKINKQRKKKVARSLIRMAKDPKKDKAWQREWLVVSLESFQDRKISKKAIRDQLVVNEGYGIWVTLDGEKYWVSSAYESN